MFKIILSTAIILSSSHLIAEEQKDVKVCNRCGNNINRGFVDVVKKCRPAVVYIETKYEKKNNSNFSFGFSGKENPFGKFQDDFFERFFKGDRGPQERQRESKGSGTGFIVSTDGYIVTNHHVVKDAEEILVEMYGDEGEKEYKAELVGCDPRTDLAVLKIQEENLPYLEFANSDDIEPGQWIVAIGHPLRLRDSVTAGVISAKHRRNLQITQLEDYVQTDASLNPGSSGSPLLDMEGKVVAVNTAIIPPSGRNMGVGFSVPSNIAKMVYDHVKETGTVNRGFLGVTVQDLTDGLIEGFGFSKNTKGALIASVTNGSAGEKAGIEVGDLVVAMNGYTIKNTSSFVTEVGKLPAGKKCEIQVIRNGKKISLEAELGSAIATSASNNDIIKRLGVVVEEITKANSYKYEVKEDQTGVVIKEVIPGSLAHRSGWKSGSLIMVINGKKIQTTKDLEAALEKSKKGKKLVALLNYKGNSLFTSITTP